MNKTLKEKLENKKIICYKMNNRIRILCNDKKVDIDYLVAMINNYMRKVNEMKSMKGFSINQSKLNHGIRIEFCGIKVSIGFIFRVYNEVVCLLELKDYPIHSKLNYDPDASIKISPSKVST